MTSNDSVMGRRWPYRRPRVSRRTIALALGLGVILAMSTGCVAADGTVTAPGLGPESVDDPSGRATGVQLLVLLTTLSLAPALLIMVTSFTRIIIVLSFLRRAMSMQDLPPTTVVTGFAVFMSAFIMRPVINISRPTGPPKASGTTAVAPMPGVKPSAMKFVP